MPSLLILFKGVEAAISPAAEAIILILERLLLIKILMLFSDRVECALRLNWYNGIFRRQTLCN